MLNAFLILLNVGIIAFVIYNIINLERQRREQIKIRQFFDQIEYLLASAGRDIQRPDVLQIRLIALKENMTDRQAEVTGINKLIYELGSM